MVALKAVSDELQEFRDVPFITDLRGELQCLTQSEFDAVRHVVIEEHIARLRGISPQDGRGSWVGS